MDYPGLADSPPLPQNDNFSTQQQQPHGYEYQQQGMQYNQMGTSAPVISESWATGSSARYKGNGFNNYADRPAGSYESGPIYYTAPMQAEYQQGNRPAPMEQSFFAPPPPQQQRPSRYAVQEQPTEPHTSKSPQPPPVEKINPTAPQPQHRLMPSGGGERGSRPPSEQGAAQILPTVATFKTTEAMETPPKFFGGTENVRKRPFPAAQPYEMMQLPQQLRAGGESSGVPEAKLQRIALVSYPAAPPAVQKNFLDEVRQMRARHNQYGAEPMAAGYEPVPSPLEMEVQSVILEMCQELAYIDSLGAPYSGSLVHSRRLLNAECARQEESQNPDWLEVDINRPVKLSKQILIPSFRYPTINFVGRILGYKGTTLQKICRKYKCYLSVMGANSTKDRRSELELIQSGDPRYAHYASPLHVRVDVIAPAHLAHMRLAAVLNLFHKMLVPSRDFDIDEELADVDLTEAKGERPKTKQEKLNRWAEEERRLEQEFEQTYAANNGVESANNGGGGWKTATGATPQQHPATERWTGAGRGRGGFVGRGGFHNRGGVHANAGNSGAAASSAINCAPSTYSQQAQQQPLNGAATPRGGRGTRGGGFVPRGWRQQQQQQDAGGAPDRTNVSSASAQG